MTNFRLFILAFGLISIIFSCSSGEPAIEVTDAWIRQVPPGIKNTALYININNSGVREEKLLNVSSKISKRAEIHETRIEDGGVGRMIRLDDLKIPENKKTKLVPGGVHIMLIDLVKEIKKGEVINVSLEFEKSGFKEVKAEVKSLVSEKHHH